MTGRTPEEDRLEAERITAENLARKEKIETERWKAEFDQKERENKRQKHTARLQFFGTIIAASLALFGTLLGLFFGVGKKADPTVTNFWGTVYEGAVSSYKLVDSHYSVADAFPKRVPVPAPAPAPMPSPPSSSASSSPSVSSISKESCIVNPMTVTSVVAESGASGYTVSLRFKNPLGQLYLFSEDGEVNSVKLGTGKIDLGIFKPGEHFEDGLRLKQNDEAPVTVTFDQPTTPLASKIISFRAKLLYGTQDAFNHSVTYKAALDCQNVPVE